MLSQALKQKLLQKLSPQQIQLMKLLQVPTVAIDQRIKEELEENPALELDEETSASAEELDNTDDGVDSQLDDFDIEDYYSEDEKASYKESISHHSPDEEHKTIPIATHATFHDHLINQIGMMDLDSTEEAIAHQIIGSIDDDGYLRRAPDAIVDDLAFSQNISTTDEVVAAFIEQIKTLDPPGVGATDLQECLLIQLRQIPVQSANHEIATRIIESKFDAFIKKHYTKLQQQYELSEEELKDVLDIITQLNPKPGSAYAYQAKEVQYIIPDFIIKNHEGQLSLSLNSRNAPELNVSPAYREMLESYHHNKEKTKADKQAILFIKQKLDSAKWFIDAIKQRQHTLHSTMTTIMNYQKEYFLSGDEIQLRPMILKDIAEITQLDISTISRVANSKYVETEFGTFKLKSFFSESLQTDDGENVSTREVKKILSELISDEVKNKPLSDQRLTEILNEKGYQIARRTVAKYREQIGLPVARLRKEL